MFKNWRLRTKTVVPAVIMMVILSALTFVLISAQQRELAINQARQTALAIAAQITADRQVYTEKVVKKLKVDQPDIKAVETKRLGDKNNIPLPASFVHLTSALVNERGFHTADLLSLWNINPDKKWRNGREKEALEQVRDNKELKPDWVTGAGKDSRFVAVTADVASAELCVTCHNGMEESPKRDFRLNDVMGGLVISVPLEKPFAEAQKNATILTGLIVAVFALLIFVISYIQWQFISKPLVRLEHAADQISMGELETPIAVESEDEVGSLAKAFERMRVSLAQAMSSLDKEE